MPFTSWLRYLISHACCTRCVSFSQPLTGALYKKEKHAPLLFRYWVVLPLNLMSMDAPEGASFFYLQLCKLQPALLVVKGSDAGEFFAFEEFQAGPAAGADVGHIAC